MLIPFLLPLRAFRKISMKQIWNPLNTSMLFIPLILNVYLPMVDNGTDLRIGIQYSDQENNENGNPWFAGLTIFVTFLPFFVRIFIEIINTMSWMIKEWNLFLYLWDKILMDQAIDLFSILPFISPIFNFDKIICLSQVKDGDPEAENILLKIGSHSSWEPFLESLPQLILQVYISIQTCPGLPLVISMVISLISLSLACSSSFLLERVKCPVASALMPKLILAIFFLFVVVPRVSNIAIFFHICMKASMLKIFIGKVIVFAIPIIIMVVLKIAITLRTNNLNGMPIWDDITNVYVENKENESRAYFKELEIKAILLSIFAPCIIVSEESMIFPISVGITTFFHLGTAGFSWVIFDTEVSFQNGRFNTSCFSNISDTRNSSCSQINKMDVDSIFGLNGHLVFRIMVALLLLSCGVLLYLDYLSSHINLRKLLKKLRVDYNHGGVIASIIEKYREREFEMEKVAKNMGGYWKVRLNRLKKRQDTTKTQTYDLLTNIAKENVNLSHPVVTRRTTNGIISETPINMIKHNRYKQDYLVSFCENLRKNDNISLNKNQTSKREPELEIHEAIKQKKDLSCLYTAIKKTTNINVEDGQNLTALMLAIQESDTLLPIRLLLYLGSSISYNNSVGTNAFEVALEHEDEKTKDYLWKRLLKEKEHHEIFLGLCKKDNIEGVKWCLKHTPSDKEMQKMIEKQEIIDLRFPLFSALIKNKTNEISLLLIKEHKRLNPAFLTTCNAVGYNVLMLAAELDSGRLQVLKQVVDIFKNTKKLDFREKGDGMNALMLAAVHADCYESVKFLVDYYKEADLISKKSMSGQTALDYAKVTKNEDLISLLKTYSE